jgi:hypothetical protein
MTKQNDIAPEFHGLRVIPVEDLPPEFKNLRVMRAEEEKEPVTPAPDEATKRGTKRLKKK